MIQHFLLMEVSGVNYYYNQLAATHPGHKRKVGTYPGRRAI